MKNTVSIPATPAPTGLSAAPMADRTPSMATALGVDATFGDLGEHDRYEHRQDRHEQQRRIGAMRGGTTGSRNSGQRNITRPVIPSNARAVVVRGPSPTAPGDPLIQAPSDRSRSGDTVRPEPVWRPWPDAPAPRVV